MKPKVLLSKSIKKIVGVSPAKRKNMQEAPPLPKGTFDKLKQAKAEYFTAGFGKARIIPSRPAAQKILYRRLQLLEPGEGPAGYPARARALAG